MGLNENVTSNIMKEKVPLQGHSRRSQGKSPGALPQETPGENKNKTHKA